MSLMNAKHRWNDPEFLRTVQPFISKIMVGGAHLAGADLAGISIGSGPVKELWNTNLYQATIDTVDLSDASISGSMNETTLRNSRFVGAHLDRCLLQKSQITDCDFSRSKLIVSLDDSTFERCSFRQSNFGTGSAGEYGGRRVRFIGCDFGEATFHRVEFRATQFIDCNLAGARFVACDLRGAKVMGGNVPNTTQFEKMDPPDWASA
jgi:uncharacterized protein YjbI with pentapeptide repeats